METIKVNPDNLPEAANVVVEFIKKGKVLILPTDTVYGLLADATKDEIVRKVFEIKNRPETNPIPIFVKDIEMAKNLVFIDEPCERFLEKVWPGKITAVLKKKNNLPQIISGPKETIGLRVPDYKLINLLFEKIDFPLTGTSANISGKPASGNIKDIMNQFKNEAVKPDFIFDYGDLESSLPSTVVDLIAKPLEILRKGAEFEKLEKIIDLEF